MRPKKHNCIESVSVYWLSSQEDLTLHMSKRSLMRQRGRLDASLLSRFVFVTLVKVYQIQDSTSDDSEAFIMAWHKGYAT